jgi:hypothetical protein
MWSDGGPIDPSPTIDQAINGGFPWLEIRCSRCQTPGDIECFLTVMQNQAATTSFELNELTIRASVRW